MKSKASPKSRPAKRQVSSPGSRWKSRLLDLAILTSTVVVGVFVLSVASRLSYSHAEKNEHPPRVLRTQVLNGCGVPELAADFGELLMRTRVEEFRFDVVDRDNFSHFEVENSFLTVYTLSPDDALRLAAALGLSGDNVFMAEKTDNPWGLDISVVLGQNTMPVLPTPDERSHAP